MKDGTPLDEQELLINYSPEMGKDCEVYTTIPWMIKYLKKLVADYPDLYRIIKEDQYSLTAVVPFKAVKPRKPRNISVEQKEASAERLRQLHSDRSA